MPVNYQQIQTQIKQLGKLTPGFQQTLQARLRVALKCLEKSHGKNDKLRDKVNQAAIISSRLRCAVPTEEALDTTTGIQLESLPATILAADGSQIFPDAHAAVLFGVVNIGIFKLQPKQGHSPQEITHTYLLYHEDLYNKNGGLISEDTISMLRDLQERQLLSEYAASCEAPVIALTDGPIELFREPSQSAENDMPFQDYLKFLKQLAALEVSNAGYVDRPRADLLVRLLELDMFGTDPSVEEINMRPLLGITDIALLETILPPGHRSAVFALQSLSSKHFQGEIALHFFYLNAGTREKPWLARVEIPAWLADNQAALNILQSTLLTQCQQMGSKPYPYVLHRAHEIALVTLKDREYLESMVIVEMLKQGAAPQFKSHKQTLKDLTGTKTRLT